MAFSERSEEGFYFARMEFGRGAGESGRCVEQRGTLGDQVLTGGAPSGRKNAGCTILPFALEHRTGTRIQRVLFRPEL
jgi:hypothetical protein